MSQPPSAKQKTPKKQPRTIPHRIALGLVGILLLAALGFAGYRGYRFANKTRLVQNTHRLLSERRYAEAAMTAKRALHLDPKNLEATRALIEVSENSGDPGALMWRKRLVALQPEALDERIKLAQMALRVGDLRTANDALAKAPEEAVTRADFQHLAGLVASARHDSVAAELHLARAHELEPENPTFTLHWAAVSLQSTEVATQAAARENLEKLAEVPAQRRQALQTLFQEATVLGDYARALSFAEKIKALPDASFEDGLPYLASLRRLRHPDFQRTLRAMQEAATDRPDDFESLAKWMSNSGLAREVLAWSEDVSFENKSTLPVRTALAQAYSLIGDWRGLRTIVTDEPDNPAAPRNWGKSEYIRVALLSRVLKAEGEVESSAARWKDAVRLANHRSDALEALARAAIGWNWEGEATEVLWALSEAAEQPAWALQQLEAIYRTAGSTRNLLRVSLKALELNPPQPLLRNNVAALSLLLGVNTGDAVKTSAELYKSDPANSTLASTYAYALYCQGLMAQGLEVSRTIPSAKLAEPRYAIFHGLLLSTTSEIEAAKKYLRLAAKAPPFPDPQALLPEERTLVEQALAKLEVSSSGAFSLGHPVAR